MGYKWLGRKFSADQYAGYKWLGRKPPVSGGFFIVYRKPPARPGSSKKLIAISLDKKTPFDYNK